MAGPTDEFVKKKQKEETKSIDFYMESERKENI